MAAQPETKQVAPGEEAARLRAAIHTVALLLTAASLAMLLIALLAVSPARAEPARPALVTETPELPDASRLPVESRAIAQDFVVDLPPPATGIAAAAALTDIAPPELPAPAPYVGRSPEQQTLAALLGAQKALAHPRLARAQREAIAAFYEARDFAPLWIAEEGWTPAARAVLARLARAGEDGLDGDHYIAPILDPLPKSARERADVLAQAELRLSLLATLFARDARGGRIEPSRLSALITPDLALPDARDVLTALAHARDADTALAAWLPRHEGYRNLKTALAKLRATRPSTPDVRVPPGPVLRVGMRDPRVPLVRARFGIGPSPQADTSTAYDQRLAEAVADFQRAEGLQATGLLNRQTVAALGGGSLARREADLIVNMERWRWLPPELGERHVFVNVPAFTMQMVENGETVHAARVIVGKAATATPIFSDEIDHLVLNPSWYVPPSILRRDFLPKLADDPGYAERNGYELRRNGRNISIRQPPGPKNALGNVKFMFPNHHAVYLHDTPNKRLFANQARAYSAGCVRVENPMRLAELLLGKENGWTQARLDGLVGKGERRVNLPRKVPVHLAYFTLSADADGSLTGFGDLYDIDARMRETLGLR